MDTLYVIADGKKRNYTSRVEQMNGSKMMDTKWIMNVIMRPSKFQEVNLIEVEEG